MENIRRKILSLENILGLFVLVMLCSCADQERQSKGVLKFDERIQLNGEQVFEKEFNHIVEVAGDYILLELNSRDTSNNVYNVYDARTLEFLGSIGKRGQGPGEFYGAQYAGQYYVKGGDTFIWVNDAPQYRITSINVTQSLEMGKTVVDRIIKHHPKYNFQNALYVSDEGDLIGYQPGFIPNSNKYPLHILKGGAGESLNEVNVGWFDIGEYPKMESLDLIPEGERFSKSFNRARIAMKPDQSRFVVGMSYYDRLDIFKKNGDLVKSARDPERYRQYNAVEVYAPEARIKLKNRYDYYQKLVATDDYIYALYWNRNMRELNAEMGEAVEIRVFDWEGNLKYLLKCPDNLILITVDEKNKYLYGYVEDDQKFMRYSIEVILEQPIMKRVKLAAACLVMVFLGYFVKSNYLHWVGPELELETDLLDFGMIEEGAPAQVYVKYKNAGLMGLKLIEASSDCGCTVVDWNTDKTGSGEVDSLLVEYDTNTVGLINRIVTINSNSADSPHSFFVIGNVVPKGSEFPSNTNTP